MKIGLRIKELRIKKGLTQEELANLTELSARTIQRIENGDVDPRAYSLQMIAKALDVDFSIFVENESEENEEEKKNSNDNFLALLHISGLFPLFFPSIIVWKMKKVKTKDIGIHFRAVISLQLTILGITLVGLWIYWQTNQPIPIVGGLIAGGLLSIINAMRVMAGKAFINPFVKDDSKA